MTDLFDTLVGRAPSESHVHAHAESQLVVRTIVDGKLETVTLPQGRGDATFVVGRGAEAHVRLGHPTISRRHAELNVEGTSIAVADLGSANGTRIGARALPRYERVHLRYGELFAVGDVVGTVLVTRSDARASRAIGQAGLATAIARAAVLADEPTFGVCTLSGDDIARDLDVLAALVPEAGHVAALSQNTMVMLLPGFDRAATERWRDTIAWAYARSRRELVTHAAAFPADGKTLETLCPLAIEAAPHTEAPSAVPPSGTSRIGKAMKRVWELVDRVAPTPASILVLGETGVGKEVVARSLHSRSKRADGPFVALNCAALPETLLESELFGHEKGAFTGAQAAKPGLIEAADGGTLFLDELGEMPLATQAKLLRVLEDRAVLRVGSVKPRPVDIRLVAATNRDLNDEIQAKRFRADLYYRLNGIVLAVPPLRERQDEIRSLASLFARKAATALDRPVPELPAAVIAALEAHAWPGNIRELRNAVERLVLLSGEAAVQVEHLPDEVIGSRPATPAGASSRQTLIVPEDIPTATRGPETLEDELSRIERARIVAALEQCVGNQTRAAEMLGITRKVLIGKMEKYRLPRPRR